MDGLRIHAKPKLGAEFAPGYKMELARGKCAKGLTLTQEQGGMNALTTHATRPAVSVNGLRKAYGEKVVLDGVDLSIGEGEVIALLGPNGAGKTTMVRILSTLIPADAGTASVMGHDLRREAGRSEEHTSELQSPV